MKLDKIKSLISQDKRTSDRLNLPIEIFYKLPLSSEWIGSIIVEDIGGNGLKFRSRTKLKKNTEINLKIELPLDSQPIAVKGRIVWCEEESLKNSGYSIGIEFSKMRYQDRKRFIKYIGKNIIVEYLSKKETKL